MRLRITGNPAAFSRNVDSTLLLVCLLALFLLAGVIRVKDLRSPGVLVEREYTSAVFARAFYLEATPSVEAWRREVAETTMERQPVLEPPVTDYLVSLLYRVAGREDLAYAHLLTSAFWLAGGLFMFGVARMLLPEVAALFATAYYLLAPSSVLLSRSFQPDSLMMMMFLASIFFMLRYFERPSIARLLLAAALSGLTLLIRPLVLFAIAGTFVALSIYHHGGVRRAVDRRLLLFFAVALAFPAAYYGYAILVAGFMRWKVAASFRPMLLLRPEFWQNWMHISSSYVGPAALIASLVGLGLQRGRARALSSGLWIAYFVFGLAFTMHIHTHSYYHAQLIPIVALGLAALSGAVVAALKSLPTRAWLLPATAAALVASHGGYSQIKAGLNAQIFESERVAREVGEIVGHSEETVFVAYHYGMPLQYYGELSGAPWPKSIEDPFYRQPGERALSVEERIENFDFEPEYYVITHLADYRKRHSDLAAYLASNCARVVEKDQYLVYNACKQPSISGQAHKLSGRDS